MRRVGKGFSGVDTLLFANMLAVRVVDAEEEVQVPAQDDVVQEHVTEEIATEVVPPTPTSPLPSSHVIPSSPPHQSSCPPQPQAAEGSSHVFQQVLDTCSALVLRVEGLENANAAQQLEIVKLKARVKKLEKLIKVKSSELRRLRKVGTSQRVESSDDVENLFNQGRISVDTDQDEGIELVVNHEKDAEVEGRYAEKQAEIYNIDLDHSSKVLSMQEDDTEVQEAIEVVTTAKLITEVVTAATKVVGASTPIPAAKPKSLKIAAAPAVSTRRRKGVVIRDPEEELHTDTPAETPILKDKGKGILIEDPKPMKKKDQIEMDAEFDANLKFLFKSREEMEKENEEIIKSINETPAQKAAKRRKLSEEAQEADDLKKRLEIVQDEDDDEAYKNIDWNAALDNVQSKETQYIKRYHGMKKIPQTESEACKNMIFYLKNTEGYKMDFFKGMTYDEILPIFQVKFEANMRFLFKSREEMEAEDQEWIRYYMEKSKECSWFGIGENMEAADFMWCSCHYSLNSSAFLIG
nr:hypothetical protein [Tanacetum cinerariifolium]